MPDLSDKGVHQFWSQYPDPVIYRVVAFMEAVEIYLDRTSPEFAEAIAKLGKELEDISAVNFNEFGEQDLQIAIGVQLKTGTTLRLMQVMDSIHPGCASKLLMYAEENSFNQDDNNGLFLRRNIVFERLRLMSRVFSPSRFEIVKKALEGNRDA